MTETQTHTSSPPKDRTRIAALDVIRGFALCGILLVNLPPIFDLGVEGGALGFYRFYEDFVQNRFFPIFSFLFGIGFGLMWLTARDRSPRPRLALLRRFAFLGVLGGLHQLLQPGEALLPYALAGIVVLLPVTWIADRWRNGITAVLGVILLVAGVAAGGGLTLIPGLFLLGFAIGGSGFIRAVLRHPGRVAIAGAIALAITIAGFAGTDYLTRQINGWINAGLGLTMALTYIVVLLLLLRTPAEAVLKSVFAPLGRMALSNYLGATVILVVVRLVAPDLARFDEYGGYLAGLLICLGTIVVQLIVSTMWLRRFGQGPLEKLWRLVTWGRSARRDQRRDQPNALTSSRE
ncbi:Uncharacterized membrane protein YeiB [Brevibacterium siliguriense]|uniref:Uncharacterized membrane protein YeiB n=1 Tax=Brevibacterium siliguriense TaxID=1136497 RepID=A0A1H1REN4_9MICO|nr:DUF418 domain-containing protein [Brevibacterium siliguriense]SDS34006.1 Uncharacterized membrane protein YeiB [Brevibacterium siliguriense]